MAESPNMFFSFIANFLGFSTLLIVPGLVWFIAFSDKKHMGKTSLLIHSLTISLFIIQIVIFFMRFCSIGDEISREYFILSILAIILSGYLTGVCRGKYKILKAMKKLSKEDIFFITMIICAIFFVFISFKSKIFIEDIDGDGHEKYWHSLFLLRPFPYQNNFVVPYLNIATNAAYLMFFGQSFASLRAAYFFYLFIAIVILYSLLRIGRRNSKPSYSTLFSFISYILLVTLFLFFQHYWEPYQTDTTAVSTNIFGSLIFLCVTWALLERDYVLFALSVALFVETNRYAPVLLILMLVSFVISYSGYRRVLVKKILALCFSICGIWYIFLFYYAWQFGQFSLFLEACKDLGGGLYVRPGSESIFIFFGKYILLAGIIPVVTSIHVIRSGDRTSRFLSLLALFYFLFLLCLSSRNAHRLLLISFLPLVAFLRHFSVKNPKYAAIIISQNIIFVFCIILLWPFSYRPHTDFKRFWVKTQLIYPNSWEYINEYLEADIKSQLKMEGLGHVFSGAWEIYSLISQRTSSSHDYFFTDKDNLCLLPKELLVISRFGRNVFLARSFQDIDAWRSIIPESADERYLSFFEFLIGKLRHK